MAGICRFGGHCKKFYCPTPDQRVLTSDLRWVPAGDIEVGDSLLAFDEKALEIGSCGKMRRRFRPSIVLHKQMVKRPCILLEMDDGSTVVASREHPWLVATKSSGNQAWRSNSALFDDIREGKARHIHRFFQPWSSIDNRNAGWLSGIFDGEGHLSMASRRGTQLGVSQNPGPVFDEIARLLPSFGFNISDPARTGNSDSKVLNLSILGSLADRLRFLGQIRPIRLLRKFEEYLRGGEGQKQMQSDREPLKIIGVYDHGDNWVAGIETSTHTYFCEGYAAHNSVAEHCVLLSQISSPLNAFAALMHDASEAYLLDIPRPLKPLLTSYQEIERAVMQAIADKFGFCFPLPEEVKRLDAAILSDERAQNMMPMIVDETWGEMPMPLGVKLQFWEPNVAQETFIQTFEILRPSTFIMQSAA